MCVEDRPRDAYNVGGHLEVAQFNGTHILSAEFVNEQVPMRRG